MTYSKLFESLTGANKQTHTMEVSDRTRVLLLPHGGRVLGLFSSGSDENFYWTHPALESSENASRFYSSEGWQNSGGDRTWLAPEVELFFPNYPDLSMSGYFQPRELDPGLYKAEEQNGCLELINRFELALFRSNVTAELELRKWIGPTANPLRYDAFAEIEFAGYEQHTKLELFGNGAACVGLWNLVQMPHPGRMLIATYSRTDPRLLFGHIPHEDLEVNDHSIVWHMRADGEHKIGVKAIATTGRVGYLYGSGAECGLVIRNFFVDPSGEYVDVPWTAEHDRGYSVQACNVNSWLGRFNELEYHVPAIGGKTGRKSCLDVSQVWAFRGEQAELEKIAERLLGTA